MKLSISKWINVLGIVIGFSAVLSLVIVLFINQGLYIGLKQFYPEGNNLIRYSEITMGLFSLPILTKLLIRELK